MSEIVKSYWSNDIYPCSDPSCDYVGPLDAFSFGQCYDACPRCGGKKERKTGRFIYEVFKEKILFFFTKSTKKFVRVEWREE